MAVHKFEFRNSRFLAKPARNAKNEFKPDYYRNYFEPGISNPLLRINASLLGSLPRKAR